MGLFSHGYTHPEFEEVLLAATKLCQKDESVKTRGKSWNLLVKNLEEYCRENDITMSLKEYGSYSSDYICYGSYTPDCKIIISLRKNNLNLFIKKVFDHNDKTTGKYELVFDSIFRELIYYQYFHFDFKEWKDILFIVKWYFEPQTDETIKLFKAAIEKKKLEYAVLNKVSEMNQQTLTIYLDMLCKKFKIKYPGISYQIEKDNSFCTVIFRLRPYYKLQVKLKYSELASQLKELESVLKKALEISSSSLFPAIILNRNLSSL